MGTLICWKGKRSGRGEEEEGRRRGMLRWKRRRSSDILNIETYNTDRISGT